MAFYTIGIQMSCKLCVSILLILKRSIVEGIKNGTKDYYRNAHLKNKRVCKWKNK